MEKVLNLKVVDINYKFFLSENGVFNKKKRKKMYWIF